MAADRMKDGVAYIDGEYVPVGEARIPILDWGVTRSDATYDVVGVWDRKFFRLDDHIDRFLASVAKLRMQLPVDRDSLADVLHRSVALSGLDNLYVSMTCTRGKPPPGSRDPRECVNRFYAFAIPYVWIVPEARQLEGARMYVSDRTRIPPTSVDPTVKNYHWLDLSAAQFDALDHGADLAVVCDEAGNVTEGHGFNIACVVDGNVVTPDRGVLRGVTRQTVKDICEELGIPYREEAVPTEMLRSADEVFVTSTAGGVMPVSEIDGKPVNAGGVGETTRRIRDTYWAWHADPRFTTAVVDREED